MPVTATLSKAFYDRFGDDITRELVEWFNQVDATYRADLRDINELNFNRFDAGVGQRFAEYQAKVDTRFVEMRAYVDRRFTEVQAQMDIRFAEAAANVDRRFAEFQAQMDSRFAEVQAQMDARFAALELRLEQRMHEQSRWVIVAWITQMAAIAGLYLTR